MVVIAAISGHALALAGVPRPLSGPPRLASGHGCSRDSRVLDSAVPDRPRDVLERRRVRPGWLAGRSGRMRRARAVSRPGRTSGSAPFGVGLLRRANPPGTR